MSTDLGILCYWNLFGKEAGGGGVGWVGGRATGFTSGPHGLLVHIEFGRLGTRLKVPLVPLIRVKKEASRYHTYLFNRLAVSGDNLRAYSRHKLLSDSHVPGK